MTSQTFLRVTGGLLLLGCGWIPARAFADEPPPLEPPRDAPSPAQAQADANELLVPRNVPPADRPPQAALPDRGLLHEAFAPPTREETTLRLAQPPPAPVDEQPSGNRPGTSARWVGGYWAWDRASQQYAWIPGAWRIPPVGKIWIEGRWRRDDRGWYRVPGFWSTLRPSTANLRPGGPPAATPATPDWRRQGPPADSPEETVGEAPGPDTFYVAGQYIPDGDRVVWRPGFWTSSRPGWEWIPARWIRQSDSWAFREGSWKRVPDDRSDPAGVLAPGSGVSSSPFVVAGSAEPNRRVVARPVPGLTGLSVPAEAARDAGDDPPTDLAPIPDEDPSRTRPADRGPSSALNEANDVAGPTPDGSSAVPPGRGRRGVDAPGGGTSPYPDREPAGVVIVPPPWLGGPPAYWPRNAPYPYPYGRMARPGAYPYGPLPPPRPVGGMVRGILNRVLP